MIRGVITRFVSAACALAVAFAMIVGLTPGTAQAAPKAAKPDTVTITGAGIQKITVTSAQQSDLFQLLLSEVSWMSTATPQTNAPRAKNLGAKYVIVVAAGSKAQQSYELYPLAVGGPRAHRGAKQPSGKAIDGWFYGRLTMSESLRHAGVPLEKKSEIGGIGGGFSEQAPEEANPVDTVNDALSQFQQLFLLNGAVLVVILFGLAGIAFLIRRRV